MKGKEPNRDDLFLEIALERGYLDETQAGACREDKAKLAEMGYSRSVIQIASEKGVVDKAKAQEIRREMQKRGVLPRVGGYEILSKLGQGGMGAVYKARQLSLDRLVALKMLPPELARDKVFLERFRREGLMAACITHPNAVQIFDVGESGGRHYLVMEYVEGASADRLLAKGPLPEKQALGIVQGVLGALAAAHGAGIVHRDIKPANILVGKDGFPKLADLGIARQAGFSGGTLTGTGAAIGTPQYMSPEQCRGEKEIDGRSDIYSLGATLYHLVCGESPYGMAESALSMIQAHVSEPLPDPRKANPALSPGVAALIKRMMAKEREDRPQDCAAVLAEIERIEGEAQQQAGAGTVATPQPAAVPHPSASVSTPPPPVTTPSAASPTQNPLATHAAAVAAALGRRKWALGIGAPLLALCVLILAVLLGRMAVESARASLVDARERIAPLVAEADLETEEITQGAEGMVLYEGKWVTEEKRDELFRQKMHEQGRKYYAEFEHLPEAERWMTEDEHQMAKGHVKYKDKWMTPTQFEQVKADEERGQREAAAAAAAERRVLDDFEGEQHRWTAQTWGNPATLAVVSHRGSRRLQISVEAGVKDKVAISRPLRIDLTGPDAVELDIENVTDSPVQMAIAFQTNEFFQSRMLRMRPGINSLKFRIDSGDYKAESTGWAHRTKIQNLNNVRSVFLLIFTRRAGVFYIDNIAAVKGQ